MVPPPATVNGVPVFVEVDNVEILWLSDNGDVAGTDHDTSGNACTVGVHAPAIRRTVSPTRTTRPAARPPSSDSSFSSMASV